MDRFGGGRTAVSPIYAVHAEPAEGRRKRQIVDRLSGLRSNAAMSVVETQTKNVTIVMGSARNDGNTAVAVRQHVIFATPVYWYAMAGPMKTFFDRMTDLIVDPKNRETGRALAGRSVWLLATGTDDGMPPGFHEPFARTAEYFGMLWRGAVYCRSIKGLPLAASTLSEAEKLAMLIVA
jgi:hypothetical protein